MKISKLGELLAENHLKSKNYRILEKNKKYRQGEIDIIARQGNCLVFIEVKTRTNRKFGYPENAFDRGKSQRMEMAIYRYLSDIEYGGNWRADLITLQIIGQKASLRHYQAVSLD